MSRLTNDKRTHLRNRIVERAFGNREVVINGKEGVVMDKVVDALLGQHKATVDALPQGWVQEVDFIYVEGEHLEGSVRRLPYQLHHVKFEDLPADITKAVEELVKERDALYEEKQEFKRKVSSVLRGANTMNQLFKAWPELREIIKDEVPAPTPNLPVVHGMIQELNAQLGIGKP